MRILINTIPLLSKRTGVGNYVFYVAEAMSRLFPGNLYLFYYGLPSRRLLTCPGGLPIAYRALLRLKGAITHIPMAREVFHSLAGSILLQELDLYFEPNFIPLPNIRPKRTVTTC